MLKFTTVGGTHNFSLEGPTVADVLVVGGGGAGGSGANFMVGADYGKYAGAGGGGGAGGLVLSNALILAKGQYDVAVGAGGAKPASVSANTQGANGQPSSLKKGGVLIVDEALGGGGGGAQSLGNDGASGGGGSKQQTKKGSGSSKNGGTATQGFSGGKGGANLVGAGGGGCRGAASDVSSSNLRPIGGLGFVSAIFGTDTCYAAGGGGGVVTDTGTAADNPSGSGVVGGAGAGGLRNVTAAKDGAAGTGGGGGGCGRDMDNAASATNIGGAGGSGVVIVRIAGSLTGDPVKPESQTLVYDGETHLLVEKTIAYTVWQKVSGVETQVDKVEGKNVGKYPATVKLVKGFTWADGDDKDVSVELNITKAQIEITDLYLESWTEQPAGAELPKPTCTINIKGVNAQYTYGTDPEGTDATSTQPTTAGDYYVFATVIDGLNYKGAKASAPFKIYNQPKTLFTDSVDISIGAYVATGSDPKELTNFPYRIELAPNKPAGFDYTRAGATGENICFTDEKGNILNHKVDSWDPNGTSVVYVRLPLLGTAATKIYLYWRVADGKEAPAYDPTHVFDDWSKEAADGFGNKPTSDFGTVVIDGKKVDSWVELPALSKTEWGVTTDPAEAGKVTKTGSVRSGRAIAYTIYNAETGAPLVPQKMPLNEGVYYVLFYVKDASDAYIDPEPQRIDVRVIDRAPFDDLKGGAENLTLGGRVMLANADSASGHEIGGEEGQAYWQLARVRLPTGRYQNYTTFWTHEGDHTDVSDYAPNLKDELFHTLYHVDAQNQTNELWRFENVMLGNTMLPNPQTGRCDLPFSSTSKSIASYSKRNTAAVRADAGTIVLCNVAEGAIVYSPAYTNGIGTIYFDAVNSRVADAGDGCRIVVEVAATTNSVDTLTAADWSRVDLTPLKRDGNAATFERLADTNELSLAIETGGSDKNFYRVCAKVNRTGHQRFRIRRSARVGDGSVPSPYNGGWISLDNILVSYPANTVDVLPYGVYDPAKTGKSRLGYEGAMANVPFPAVGEPMVARARTVAVTNSPVAVTDPFVQLTKMHYQWHYLEQATNAWQTVDLRVSGDDLVADVPLNIPAEQGDVRFWFETFTKVPFYDYYDYSGAGLKLGGLYTEETNKIITAGDNLFVRMRLGTSDWSEIVVRVEKADAHFGEDVSMELIGDHTWRGLAQVPTNVQGEVNFYFQGKNRWEAGGAAPAQLEQFWYPTAAVTNKMPTRGQTSISGKPQPFHADGATGFYEFQFNDVDGLFTIGHAEYQDFNSWHDAYTTNDTFVGTSVLTSGVSIASMVTTNTHMKTWATLDVDNDNWQESFFLTDYDDPGYPKNKTFTTHKMPHQWNGENGMFVDAMLTATDATSRQKNSGIGWQMQGYGIGSVSFTSADVPNGLDQLSFTARLAQAVTFEDISYGYGDGMMATNNYSFLIPAILSLKTADGKTNLDFSPGASMSVFGYYQPWVGCYEFRVSREDNANLRFSIYKWAKSGYRMTATLLGTHLFSVSGKAFWLDGGSDIKANDMLGMFIALGNETATPGATTIIAGLSTALKAPNSGFSGANFAYRALKCVDSENPHTCGSIGVLSTSCNGRFLTPRLMASLPTVSGTMTTPTTAEKTATPQMTGYYNSTAVVTFDTGSRNENHDYDMMANAWAYPFGRLEMYENSAYGYKPVARGFRPPVDLNQTVDVYLKSSRTGSASSEDAAWTFFTNRTISSYGWSTHVLTIRTNQNCHVMLKTGDAPADVTIGALPAGATGTSGGIKLTAWNGQDMVNPPDDDFIFTQAAVTTNMMFTSEVLDPVGKTNMTVVTTNKYCKLQPGRADPAKPVSIRSPILRHGVGMIGFSYTNLCEGAEIWVQMCTNNVIGDLTGSDGLNLSIKEGTGRREWETIRKFTYDELKGSDAKQHFIGVHDRIGAPVVGVLRIVVPTHVVETAAGLTLTKPEYGAITITDVVAQDEPALDTYSWLGWNIRTYGDRTDSERRMYLPDPDAGDESGLSSGLNNSTTDGIKPGSDPTEYSLVNPTIQSPTFRKGSIGYVRFRARVYDNSGVVGEPATVSLYGVMDAGEGDWGEPITNFTVTSSRFTEFEHRATIKRYATIRLAVNGVIEGEGKPARVLIDEVIVSEKTEASVGFVYARPFRSHLDEDVPLDLAAVLGMDEQPLTDESWGIQAQVKVDQFDQDIDLSEGFRVKFSSFVGETPWGYANWCTNKAASKEVELKQVGDPADYIFRSTVEDPDTVMKPTRTPNTTVQYMVQVGYKLKGEPEWLWQPIEVVDAGDGWTNPDWYWPVDKNAGKSDTSPYTILDGMSPGRAWINEVNYNDGPKDENGKVKIVTNQFIEVAVPWNVDMKGWYLTLTDMNLKQVRLATFGSNVPTVKNTGEKSGDYGFMVLESPGTKKAGSIKDWKTGQPIADGTWTSSSLSSTFTTGELQYNQPYQIELYRPSGILEHQFVIAGTNEWRTTPEYWKSFGYRYEGTNLLNELNVAAPSVRRFFAGEDLSRKPSAKTTFASFGVTGGAHGEKGGWSDDMKFTPGRLNEGQDALTGWYIRPNGGSIWVYATVDPASRGNVAQRIGDDTSQDTLVIVPSGTATNIVYDVKPWYAVDAVAVTDDGRTNYVFRGAGANATFNLNNVTETVHVVAKEGIDPQLDGRLDPNDRYTPAILRWLRDGSLNGTFKHPEGPIQDATYLGLHAGATNCVIGLKGMYWFDIDPTEGGWWLRGGFVDMGLVDRMRRFNASSKVPYKDPQLGVKLYLSNDVSQAVYAPKRLQGVGGERSDDPATYSSWTSVTFKVEAELENGMEHNVGYLPFRWFVFGPDSFVKPEDAATVGRPAYSTKIEILDPFSTESPGYSYGWRDYRGKPVYLRWNINEDLSPSGVETLKADSTYEASPLFEH